MTREEAIADIKHSVNWAKENDERWCDSVPIGSLELALEALEQLENEILTYDEQLIFLSAMRRERSVCEKIDKRWANESGDDHTLLVPIVDEIERKVKEALWSSKNDNDNRRRAEEMSVLWT